MKLQDATTEVEISDSSSEGGQFTMKATSHAYEILSSGLYTNKILAIVRELSCNAYDSHIAAGKREVPFEIRLPNSLDSTFYVKDFGTGLSHKDMMSLYTTYFQSSKTESDDFIGQLGLGSKSPFSYASSFIVESIHGGVHRLYTCYKDDHNMPAIKLMSEKDTTEQNGVTIRMAVRKEDFNSFIAETENALTYFKVKPRVIGATIDHTPVEYAIDGSLHGLDWSIRSGARSRGINVIQGTVSYPLDFSIIEQHADQYSKNPDVLRALEYCPIDMYVPVGAVRVAASREGLSYVPKTIQNLIGVLDRFPAELAEVVKIQMSNCTTRWEAIQQYYKVTNILRSVYSLATLLQGSACWNNIEFNDIPLISVPPILPSVEIAHMQIADRGSNKHILYTLDTYASFSSERSLRLNPNTLVLVRPFKSPANKNQKIIRWARAQRVNGQIPTHVLIISNVLESSTFATDLDQFLNTLGNPRVDFMDKIVDPNPPVSKPRGQTRPFIQQALKFKYNKNTNSVWYRDRVDYSAGGVYVELHGARAYKHVDIKSNTTLNLIDCAHMNGVVDVLTNVIGLSSVQLAKAKKEAAKSGNKWVEFNDHVKANWHKIVISGDSKHPDAVIRNVISSWFFRMYVITQESYPLQTNVLPEIAAGPFREVWDKYASTPSVRSSSAKDQYQNLHELANSVGIVMNPADLKSVPPEAELEAEWENIEQLYPMFGMVYTNYINRDQAKVLIEYINERTAVINNTLQPIPLSQTE